VAPSEAAWSADEQVAADLAVQNGLREMSAFMNANDERVPQLWDNAVEAFINSAYAASNQPELQARSLEIAAQHLQVLARPYMSLTGPPPTCEHVSEFLTLAVYAHSIAQRAPKNSRMKTIRDRLVERTNLALDDCGTLDAVLGFDPVTVFDQPEASNPDVYGWIMWSVTLTDAVSNPDLKMPPGSDQFIAKTWRYLSTYTVPQGRDHPDGLNHMPAYDAAYLMTHAGYMPTGYGRHQLTVSSAPWLYRYIRENYYAAMKMGELDLFAEFVDLLRQYGCTEETDFQLRHGSRYLLSLYRTAGGSWMAHREPYEGVDISDYDALHKPWTAIAGLRRRVFEPLSPGSFGATFQSAVERGTSATASQSD